MFDENVKYAEDALWQKTVIDAGFSIVYAADAVVYHTHEVTCSGVYKDSKDCAYTMASMAGKPQSVLAVFRDIGLFSGFIPILIVRNLEYMWKNNYRNYLKIVPFFVLSARLGWLVGRIKYHIEK
jgi:hypothetical protein